MTGLGQLNNRVALVGRQFYERVVVATRSGGKAIAPGSFWPHPYDDVAFWNEAFSKARSQDGRTHDWLLEYPDIKQFRYVVVSDHPPESGMWMHLPASLRLLLESWLRCASRTTLEDAIDRSMHESCSRNCDLVKSSRVLITGCGTSPLAEQLFDDGWSDITSVDFSSEAIAAALARVSRSSVSRHGLKWGVVDATRLGEDPDLKTREEVQVCSNLKNGEGLLTSSQEVGDDHDQDQDQDLSLGPSSVDVVLDKGLLDALLLSPPDTSSSSSSSSVVAQCSQQQQQQQGPTTAAATPSSSSSHLKVTSSFAPNARLGALSQSMFRVLRTGGVWVVWSLSAPAVVKASLNIQDDYDAAAAATLRSSCHSKQGENRDTPLGSEKESLDWEVTVLRIPNSYLYFLRKQKRRKLSHSK